MSVYFKDHTAVSTHSRLKAAGHDPDLPNLGIKVSTHSRLKAAGPSAEY